ARHQPTRGGVAEDRVADEFQPVVRNAMPFAGRALVHERRLDERGIDIGDAARFEQCGQTPPPCGGHSCRAKTTDVLCPPKPKPFEIATSIVASRATFGT